MRADAESNLTPELIQAAARQRWLEYREQQVATRKDADWDKVAESAADLQKDHEQPDDEFSLQGVSVPA